MLRGDGTSTSESTHEVMTELRDGHVVVGALFVLGGFAETPLLHHQERSRKPSKLGRTSTPLLRHTSLSAPPTVVRMKNAFINASTAVVAVLCFVCLRSAAMNKASSSRASTTTLLRRTTSLAESDWTQLAAEHKATLQQLLYPTSSVGGEEITKQSLKSRMHSVANHPVYNFLHTYYRYSTDELLLYSPGMDVTLLGATKEKHGLILSQKFSIFDEQGCVYDDCADQPLNSRYGLMTLSTTRDILKATASRKPFLGYGLVIHHSSIIQSFKHSLVFVTSLYDSAACYRLHEWAMLYSGREQPPLKKHQESLPLRLPQEAIDKAVTAGQLR